MAKSRPIKKKPSRVAYEREHPTVSFRLDKETKIISLPCYTLPTWQQKDP
jgi:hypothetical protein